MHKQQLFKVFVQIDVASNNRSKQWSITKLSLNYLLFTIVAKLPASYWFLSNSLVLFTATSVLTCMTQNGLSRADLAIRTPPHRYYVPKSWCKKSWELMLMWIENLLHYQKYYFTATIITTILVVTLGNNNHKKPPMRS